ncbi:hypothetical protein [Flavobacterium sp.]|uniref:hypothetical protein n=1 Tax=Flavobacterium sp. TaxID=239 RepID=UPI002616293F|nr:hypothetical protein [Flavobacterium sp.]
MTKKQYENATGIFSTQLAIGSFIIGTILLIMHLLFPNGYLLFIGVLYVIIAILVNLLMLLQLLYLLLTQKNHQDYFTIKILILLANIPIAFVYLKIVLATL